VYWGLSNYDGAHPDCLQFDGGLIGATIRRNHFEKCANSFIMITPDSGTATNYGLFNITIEQNIFEELGAGIVGVGSYYGVQCVSNPAGPNTEHSGGIVFRYNAYDPKNSVIVEGFTYSPPRLTCQASAPYAATQVYGNIFKRGPNSGECQTNGTVWSYNVFEDQGGSCGTNATNTSSALYVDRANDDFRLQSGSPAINAGTTSNYPATDYFGNTRYVGTAPDAGIHEKG
jgi:hypothetical protein